jgi:hypothetical protein
LGDWKGSIPGVDAEIRAEGDGMTEKKLLDQLMVYLHIIQPGGWKGVQSPLDNVLVESVIHQ